MSLLTVPGVVVGSPSPRNVPRWQTGVGFLPDDCDVPFSQLAGQSDYPYWWECPGDAGQSPVDALETSGSAADGTKAVSTPEAVETFDAVTLWAGVQCRAGADAEFEDARQRASTKLEALTPTAVEHELWTGDVAALAGFANPALADSGAATLVDGGTPLGFVTALAELEQAIADTAPLTNPAIIHAQPRVVTAWRSEDLVEPVPTGTHLVTACGTIVVPERGATGESPGQVNPAQTANYAYSWAYATGMVHVWISAPRTPEQADSVERTQNTLTVRAERDMIAAWNPCGLVAARVALCDVYCTGGS